MSEKYHLYNKAMEQLGLKVAVDREAYENMFVGPKGPIIRGMQGTIIELPEGRVGTPYCGSVKIKFEDQAKVKQLQWENDERWFLTGALSEVREEQ